MSEFGCKNNAGYFVPLPNGYSISVQFGRGNYCEHYDLESYDKPRESRIWKSKDAETALISPDGVLIEYKGEKVQANQTPEDLLEMILFSSQLARTLPK